MRVWKPGPSAAREAYVDCDTTLAQTAPANTRKSLVPDMADSFRWKNYSVDQVTVAVAAGVSDSSITEAEPTEESVPTAATRSCDSIRAVAPLATASPTASETSSSSTMAPVSAA